MDVSLKLQIQDFFFQNIANVMSQSFIFFLNHGYTSTNLEVNYDTISFHVNFKKDCMSIYLVCKLHWSRLNLNSVFTVWSCSL